MGFFGKLFGTDKIEVTPDKMAHVVLDAAVDLAVRGEDSVRGILQSVGIEEGDEEVRFQAELIAYQLFLLDVIVNRTFEDDAARIRERLRERFADLAVRVAQKAGTEPKPRADYIAYLESRFTEYTPALRRSMKSEGKPEHGGFALPEAVLANVTGSNDPDLAAIMALHTQWPMVFKEYPDAFQDYEIVTDE